MKFSFCESQWASSSSRWHIRQLTAIGKKTGGGIDTGSLCGHVKAHHGWDLEVDVETSGIDMTTIVCRVCVLAYAALVGSAAGLIVDSGEG